MDGRRLSFTDLAAKRSGSKKVSIKPLDQVATALLLTSDTMIAESKDTWGFRKAKCYLGQIRLKGLDRHLQLIENEIWYLIII